MFTWKFKTVVFFVIAFVCAFLLGQRNKPLDGNSPRMARLGKWFVFSSFLLSKNRMHENMVSASKSMISKAQAGMVKQCAGKFHFHEFEARSRRDCLVFFFVCLFVFSELCDISFFRNKASCIKNEVNMVVRHLLFTNASRSSRGLKD